MKITKKFKLLLKIDGGQTQRNDDGATQNGIDETQVQDENVVAAEICQICFPHDLLTTLIQQKTS